MTALPSGALSFNNAFFPQCVNDWNKLNDNFKLEIQILISKLARIANT